MKKPEEIKKGIEKCLSDVPCRYECPYAKEYFAQMRCAEELQADILEYIAQLEERVAIMTEGDVPKREETKNACAENDARIFYCESCGYGIEDIYLKDENKYQLEPYYCPNCGRWVVHND